jgi:hypothetical protein
MIPLNPSDPKHRGVRLRPAALYGETKESVKYGLVQAVRPGRQPREGAKDVPVILHPPSGKAVQG